MHQIPATFEGTTKLGLEFDGGVDDNILGIYTDASFADDRQDRKSSQGFLIPTPTTLSEIAKCGE